MAKNRGFTLIELLIVIVIIGIIASIAIPIFGGSSGRITGHRATSQNRAKEAAMKFIRDNNIQVKRMSAAADRDNDGYGSVTIVAQDGEKIFLQCPTGWLDNEYFGANECKEVMFNGKVSTGIFQ